MIEGSSLPCAGTVAIYINGLVKLSSGVNFINALRATFTHADPKSAKKTVKLSVVFTLLGSAHVKAAHRTLMKLIADDESES